VGLASWLGFNPKVAQSLPQAVASPRYELIPEGVSLDEYLKSVVYQPVEKLWREQPHLRTVVGFIARNIAQLSLHVFERDSDDGRNRLRTGPLVDLLREPNAEMTQFELIEATMASRCLYDETYWYVTQDSGAPSGWAIRHIPTSWVINTVGESAFTVQAYRVALPQARGQFVELPADQMIVFHGFNPVDPKRGTSPVAALRAILAEQIHAQVFRDQMWQRGGRVGNWIYRPKEVSWSDEARQKWVEQYRDNYAGDKAPKAGGEPLFEDGMELRSTRFSAKDEQFVESSKLSLQTCAQVYHINPTMVGLLDNANYSNVREFRRMLYGDNLGPEIEGFAQRLNKRLVPRLADRKRVYVEFNLQAKLAGSFEEQAAIGTQQVGGPWMTINEFRARLNMPRVEGGDELIRPLNVTQAGDQEPIPAEPKPAEEPADLSEETKHNGRSYAHF
jgi:HK97 family phage portal protein